MTQDATDSVDVRPPAGGTVLVGVDGTDVSINALAYAMGLARRQGARLLVVHVTPFVDYALDVTGRYRAAVPPDLDTDWLEEYVERARRELGVSARLVLCSGDPSERLLEQARREWADVIVVGQSRGLVHRLVGAVGRKLQRRARVPVTVVP